MLIRFGVAEDRPSTEGLSQATCSLQLGDTKRGRISIIAYVSEVVLLANMSPGRCWWALPSMYRTENLHFSSFWAQFSSILSRTVLSHYSRPSSRSHWLNATLLDVSIVLSRSHLYRSSPQILTRDQKSCNLAREKNLAWDEFSPERERIYIELRSLVKS